MAEILAENLSGKAVMGSDGGELGMLYNISVDLKSGRLINLLVTPDEDRVGVEPDYELDDEGHYLIPVANVQAVKDYIIVER